MIIRDRKAGSDADALPVWIVVAAAFGDKEFAEVYVVDSRISSPVAPWCRQITPPVTLREAVATTKLLQGAVQSWT